MRGERLLAAALLAGRAIWAAGTLPVPATGIYLGIWADPSLASNQEKAIELREGPAPTGINRPFALHLHYYQWSDLSQELNNGVFQPDTQLLGDLTHGRIPVISWACDGQVANSDHVIAGGNASEDAVIAATARALAQYPGPILLRWFWEFNDLTNNQVCRGDNGKAPAPQVYSDFIGAWQHIRTLFQSAGATNVLFLWNPGHYNSDGGSDDPHGFYPGNNYVDWIGVDTYQRSASSTFADDFGLFYTDFTASQFGNKPLMVGENGALGFSQNNTELQWTYLQGLLADVQSNRYPQLKAYCYFDAPGNTGAWVLDNNNGQGNGGLAAFAALAGSLLFEPPAITLVANAEGGGSAIAPNTWVEIKGVNLAPAGDQRTWQASDFVNGKMPTQLDGTGATVNSKSAYVYYISPTQVNILTPPDPVPASVAIQVTVGNGSAGFIAPAQAEAPSFFVFNGEPYVAATHANGSLLGPVNLYPGSTTPCKPGETVVLYANGFGSTSVPLVSGSPTQTGTLPSLPVITIGGLTATVTFAGLNLTPGEFQFNVVIPAPLANGDQPIVATYNDFSTQAGALITIQN